MKKLFVVACAAIVVISCNNKTESTSTTTSDSTHAINYAYLPDNHPPDNWEPGDQKNVAMVLDALKAFETGNVDASVANFADSVRLSTDGFDATISKDSLRAIFNEAWKNMSSVKIKMSDYEAVISKDKKNEWVTMWYTQIITDKAGKVDSAAYADDLKIENGKITVLDEKSRKFPAKK